MPRYFFDVNDGADVADEDGIELLDVGKAKIEAAVYVASLLRDDPERFWRHQAWTVRVRDERGFELFGLAFFAHDAPVIADIQPC